MDASALASAESWLSAIAVAKLVAAFLVAAGVVIEFGGDWISRPYERVVKEAREAQLASLNNDTVRLSAEAERAKSEIAIANARAAEATQRALEAQLALEKYRAPRALTAEQQGTIEEALKPFAGQQYSLSVAAGTEPASLLCVLDNILKRSGWIQHSAMGAITVGTDCGTAALNSLSGFDVRRGVKATAATIAAINALGNALAPTEAAARLATDPVNNTTEDVIILMVGAKP